MNQWKPIETAPKDGTSILGYMPEASGVVSVIWWVKTREAWHSEYSFEHGDPEKPTHWMELPQKPGEEE